MSNPFHPEQLLPILQRLPKARRYWIALSGGLDSSVLLHALAQISAQLPAPMAAIHVDHGLSAESARWSAHCRRQCEALGVEYHLRQVVVDTSGRGVEAAAREARYGAIAELLGEGDMLLSAHHQDDQAETLLLQLLRGGGVRGLAAMPDSRPLAKGWLGRPLLRYSREALRAYAEAQGLEWVEDPSNFDTSLERNYLRHELLPALEQRNQGIKAILARSAGHFAESAELLDELAGQDLVTVSEPGEACLSIPALLALTPSRQRNLLRYWLRCLGLSIPDSRNLQRILDEVLPAAEDAQPLVVWHGAEVRRYRGRLYAMVPLVTLSGEPVTFPWSGGEVMALPKGLGMLRMNRVEGEGIREELLKGGLTIGWRCGGERIAPPGRGGHHLLKKLYQEAGIPPWERERRPLLYIDGQLAQVAGLWTESRFACGENAQGIQFEWSYAIEKAGENDDN